LLNEKEIKREPEHKAQSCIYGQRGRSREEGLKVVRSSRWRTALCSLRVEEEERTRHRSLPPPCVLLWRRGRGEARGTPIGRRRAGGGQGGGAAPPDAAGEGRVGIGRRGRVGIGSCRLGFHCCCCNLWPVTAAISDQPLPSHPKVCCGGASGGKAAPGDGEDGARPEDDDRGEGARGLRRTGATGLGAGGDGGGDGRARGERRTWEAGESGANGTGLAGSSPTHG
jgi:hypothetical protein